MNKEASIHKAQASVLSNLRHATRARYSELLRPTGLDGDIFKYHLKKLVNAGYVLKAPDGIYELTAEGKEYANRLDEKTGRQIQQPKASTLMIVRSEENGETKYLAHRRMREPFYDFWGIASAPILRGVPIKQSATREIEKQTGIKADFEVFGSFRVIDKTPSGTVLEDKLFSILVADVLGCPAAHYWSGGESVWLSASQLLSKKRLFPTTARTIKMIEAGQYFAEEICVYTADMY